MQRIMHYCENNRILQLLTDRNLFIKIYLVTSILWFFPALGTFIDPLSKVCFVWGAALIFYDILGKRFFFLASYWYCIVAMLGVYCITILLNLQTNFYMGIKHLIYTAISLMIIYTQNGHTTYKKEKKLLKWINSAIIVIVFCASVISLVMYCLRISIYFEQNGMTFRQGFLENRLFGVYTSPNVGALFSVICIAAICINSYLVRGSFVKWRKSYIINGVVQLIYFSLTLSNGGFLTACVFLVLLVCVFGFMKLKQNKKLITAGLISALIAMLSVVGLGLAMQGIRTVMSVVPSTIQYIVDSTDSSNNKDSVEKIRFERIESGDDASNGRTAIWSGSLKIWIQAPIFGIADARVDEDNLDSFGYSLSNLNDAEMERMIAVGGNLHNAYIQILTDSGIAGLLCFFVLIILIVKRYVKYLFMENVETDSYKIIGMLFCVLGAIGANGMVENHLLFNRQDPYGIIFWFYLGCGLILIKRTMAQAEFKDYVCRKQTEKFLFVCDTPLQLFNTTNFVVNNQMGAKGKSDVVVVHQFRNSFDIANRLREQQIFGCVYDAEPILEKRGIKSKIHTLYRFFRPKKAVQKILVNKGEKIKSRYRYFFLSFQTPTTISFQLTNSYADVYLMEDGLGTYIGNIEEDFTSPLYKFVNKYFFESRMSLKPMAIYLNNPKICHSRINASYVKLPELRKDSECLEKLQYIFDYSIDQKSSLSKIIYMTQPLEGMEGDISNPESEVIAILNKISQKSTVEVRVHPRQKNYVVEMLNHTGSSQMWELECIYKIKNNQVLIAANSTALFMPKILKGTEPVLIFIYKLLFTDADQQRWREWEKFVLDFAKDYEDSSRVYIPESIEEFEQIIERYI